MVLHRPIELASSAQEKLWDFKLLRVNFKKVLRRPVELAAVTRQVPLTAKKGGTAPATRRVPPVHQFESSLESGFGR